MLPLIFTNHIAAQILIASYFIWLVPEIIHTFSHHVEASSRVHDHYSSLVLRVSLGTAVFSAYWLARMETWATISWHPVLIFGLGISLMVIGVLFRWYAIRVLGKYFSVRLAVQPGQTVMQEGPYHWIRHPSYTGSLITMLGLGLAFTNWLCLVSVPLIVLIGYSYRANVEERMLLEGLGDSYREYMKRTKRFIPFVY
ncbi:MAG TPA: isoprenylcysteine carboxylmethyltransferase family protein [Anaerolineales bacterium]|nr:isoprenylcysteine carboxylmethyltransferase family protein [Anaerolineales bacterium]